MIVNEKKPQSKHQSSVIVQGTKCLSVHHLKHQNITCLV